MIPSRAEAARGARSRERCVGLVYHAGALGDFITTLPAIAAWRRLRATGRAAPQPTVLLGKPVHARLVPSFFDQVWDAGRARFAPLLAGEPSAELADQIEVVAEALVFAAKSSGIEAGLRALGVPRVICQQPFPPTRTHVVDWHLSLFPDLPLSEAERTPRVGLARQTVARLEKAEASVAVAPGSGSPKKNWPLERFLALADELSAAHERVAWVLGPVEQETGLAERIARARPAESRWLDCGLRALAGRLSTARLFVGNDSGVAHLAAAAGCPVVVLFGASDPAVWAPRGKRVQVVGNGASGMEMIAPEDVSSACQQMLSMSAGTR